MRIRITTAAVVAVLAVTVVGCSTDKDGDAVSKPTKSAAPEASATADGGGEAKGTGIPPEPTGAERDAVLAAVRDVDATLTHDEDKAIDAARNQCASLDGGAKDPDHDAAQRFSYDGVTLTDEDGGHINFGLRKTLCPES
ncbi:hypothetical protein AB0M10_16350 [Streptomyces sp. NPDC051840]|uniref:hypothetical protein n=1 Tax=unclassified Streptomyces TaxID=2593676 RepID=UPI00342D1F1C